MMGSCRSRGCARCWTRRCTTWRCWKDTPGTPQLFELYRAGYLELKEACLHFIQVLDPPAAPPSPPAATRVCRKGHAPYPVTRPECPQCVRERQQAKRQREAAARHTLEPHTAPETPEAAETPGPAPTDAWCLWCGMEIHTEEDDRRHQAQCPAARGEAPTPAEYVRSVREGEG